MVTIPADATPGSVQFEIPAPLDPANVLITAMVTRRGQRIEIPIRWTNPGSVTFTGQLEPGDTVTFSYRNRNV